MEDWIKSRHMCVASGGAYFQKDKINLPEKNNKQKQIYKHEDLVIQTFTKWNQMNLFGDLRAMNPQENINKNSDLHPRRFVNRKKCKFPNFRIKLNKTRKSENSCRSRKFPRFGVMPAILIKKIQNWSEPKYFHHVLTFRPHTLFFWASNVKFLWLY